MHELFDERFQPFNETIESLRDSAPFYLQALEPHWQKFAPFASKTFQKSFLRDSAKFNGLIWEMLLASKLIEHGYNLVPDNYSDDDRPDLCIDVSGKKVWIECCVPTLGDPASEDYAISEKNADGVMGASRDGLLLRCTQALNSKKKQYEKWLSKGICDENDPYIIAINGHAIRLLWIEKKSLPSIMGALYEMGPLSVQFDKTSEETSVFFEHRPLLTKKNDVDISTGFFLDEQNFKISGVIYSTDWIHTSSSNPKYCYVENVNARNRKFTDFGKFMQTYFYTENSIRMASEGA